MAPFDDEWMNRKEAARYLSSQGCPISARTLEKMAGNNNQGKGPAFNRSGWRTVRYQKVDLDLWRIGRVQRVE